MSDAALVSATQTVEAARRGRRSLTSPAFSIRRPSPPAIWSRIPPPRSRDHRPRAGFRSRLGAHRYRLGGQDCFLTAGKGGSNSNGSAEPTPMPITFRNSALSQREAGRQDLPHMNLTRRGLRQSVGSWALVTAASWTGCLRMAVRRHPKFACRMFPDIRAADLAYVAGDAAFIRRYAVHARLRHGARRFSGRRVRPRFIVPWRPLFLPDERGGLLMTTGPGARPFR